MISYSITSRQLNPPRRCTKKRRPNPADPDFKRVMLDKLNQNHKYSLAQRVRKVATHMCGTIKEIEFNADKCEWHNDTPRHIFVVWDDGSEEWTDVYKLSRKKVTK